MTLLSNFITEAEVRYHVSNQYDDFIKQPQYVFCKKQ